MLAGLALGASTASAVTLGHAGGLKYVRTTTPLPLAGFEEKKARCGGSWHVFGGGAQLSGPTISGQLESTTPFDGGDGNAEPDDGWLGAASNLGSVPLTLKTYAICSHTNPDYGNTTAPLGDVGSVTGAGLICGPGPETVGGGIRPFAAPGDTHLIETRPPPGNPELSEWDGSVHEDAVTGDAQLRVYAVCTTGMDLTWRHEYQEIEGGPASVDVSADCPSGTHVTGGGVLVELGSNTQAAASWINTSRPLDDNDPGHVPDDGWTASAQVAAGADGASAYAVCAD
jgi:hypothetical protein